VQDRTSDYSERKARIFSRVYALAHVQILTKYRFIKNMTNEETLILIAFLEGFLRTGSPSIREIIKYLERKMEPLIPVESIDIDKKKNKR